MDIFSFSILLILVIAGGGIAWYFLKPAKQHKQTESLYINALNAMIRGDKASARKQLRDVVKQDSNHIGAYLQLGNILREDNPHQAIKIHQSLTVRPNLPNALKIEIYQALALDYQQVDQLSRAKREAERILKIDKRNLWATEFLLQIAETERNWSEATVHAKAIQKITNTQDAAQLAKFQVYDGMDQLESGEVKNARNAFLKATKIAPEFGLPYFYLGELYEQERNLVKAIEYWEKFAQYSPEDSHKVFLKIESALFDLGRFSEAENFYRRVLDNDPANLDALTKLANVLEEKGEHQMALGMIDEALEKKGDSIHVRLMKLKLSLKVATPHELSLQINQMIDLLSNGESDK